MGLAHVRFDERGNFAYEAYLLREDDGSIVGINLQIRDHRWYYIWPWREWRR